MDYVPDPQKLNFITPRFVSCEGKDVPSVGGSLDVDFP